MYIVLPEKENGLEKILKNVSPTDIRKQIMRLDETSVEVILPKFKFNYKTDLKPVLKKV